MGLPARFGSTGALPERVTILEVGPLRAGVCPLWTLRPARWAADVPEFAALTGGGGMAATEGKTVVRTPEPRCLR